MLPNWLYGKSLRKLQEILNSGGQTAAGVSYSNTESGLEATNAQDAIDEIAEDLDTKAAQSTVSTLSDTVTTLTGTVNSKVGWSDYAQSGAVNLLPNNATSQVVSPVIWTVNEEKVVTAVASSALSAVNAMPLNENFTLKKGTYRLSGCPSDGSNETYRLQIYTADNVTAIGIDIGEGVEFTLSEDTAVRVVIRLGTELEAGTLTFYPMIAPVGYAGSYVPYAKTNAELTDDVKELTSEISNKISMPVYSNGTNIALSTDGVTMTGDGMLSFNGFYGSNSSSSGTAYVRIHINDAIVITGSIPGSATDYRPFNSLVPVKSGDIVKYSTSGTIDSNTATFFPYA